MATGVEVQLDKIDMPEGEGYRFAVLGDHDGDVDDLAEQVRAVAETEIGRVYLETSAHRDGWVVSGDEVRGRLVWNDDGGTGKPYNVVVDGRTLTWKELGTALEPFEGWNFRLTIEDSIRDARLPANE